MFNFLYKFIKVRNNQEFAKKVARSDNLKFEFPALGKKA